MLLRSRRSLPPPWRPRAVCDAHLYVVRHMGAPPPAPPPYPADALPRADDPARILLALDLDDTLIHTSRVPPQPGEAAADMLACARGGGESTVYVRRRPHVGAFVAALSRAFDLAVFTASPQQFAEEKIDWLASTLADETPGALGRRLYRSSCVERYGLYIKDLRVFGRPPGRALLVEDLPCVGGWQPDQVVPIAAWRGDPSDDALPTLLPHLLALSKLRDVRPALARAVGLRRRAAALGDDHRGCARLAAEQDAPPAVGPPTPPPAHAAAAAAASADDPWGAGDPAAAAMAAMAAAALAAPPPVADAPLPPCTCTGNMHALLRGFARRAAGQAPPPKKRKRTVLDGGWAAVVSRTTGDTFYANSYTGETTWEPPPEATAGFALTRDPTAVPGGIPPPAKAAAAAEEAAKAAPAGATPATAAGAKTKSVCVEA